GGVQLTTAALHACPAMLFFSSRRRHTRSKRDWSSDVCSSDLPVPHPLAVAPAVGAEQRDLLAVQRPFDGGEHGLELPFFQLFGEIGRASCRERVKVSEAVAGARKTAEQIR